MSEAAVLVRPGAPIPLHLQLESLDTDRTVKAYLVQALDGAAFAGSPFTLVHSSNGLYLPASQPSMPTDADLIATYLVFNGTDPDPENLPGVDFFRRDYSGAIIDQIGALTGGIGGLPKIEGTIGPAGLEGDIRDEDSDPADQIDGQMGSAGIAGDLGQDLVDGQLGSETIEGEIEP